MSVNVKSSLIKSVDYMGNDMVVTLNSNKSYKYASVPKATYDKFLKASSKGQFFNRNIRDKFTVIAL